MTDYTALTAQVELAKTGDRSAFARLVESTQNLVTSVALGIVNDVRASEDIAQEAYVQTWQKLSQLQRSKSFLPWLRQITRHCALQWLEKEKHNHGHRQQPLEPNLETLVSDQYPDRELDQHQRQQILTAALAQLPDDTRDIVVLYYREQQSTQHVAELLGLQPATIRQRLSRARQQLETDLLRRVGKAALLSAPALSVTTILSSAAMLASPPAVAASSASTVASMSGVGKWLAFIGVTAIGLLGALAGLFIGSQQAQKHARSAAAKEHLVTLRNRAAWFLLVVGGVFFASYQFDPSWVTPTISYTVLVIGVAYYQRRVQHYVNVPASKRWTCYVGVVFGFGGGLAGLIGGFIASGRI